MVFCCDKYAYISKLISILSYPSTDLCTHIFHHCMSFVNPPVCFSKQSAGSGYDARPTQCWKFWPPIDCFSDPNKWKL